MASPFDDAWADAIADIVWPERLVEAVQQDPAALATDRAVRSLRSWRATVRSGAPGAKKAAGHLEAIGEALAGPPLEASDEDRSALETEVLKALPTEAPTRPEASKHPTPAQRPPAAEVQVRAMASALWPLADEIIPLARQRRARRFWARWREVAGDRGVRREFVEALLARVEDRKELLAQLIAEVHSVDPDSVAAHLHQLPPADIDAQAASTRPLVGASVRPEPLSPRGETER